jgi:GT2 family glycosyltransferase
MVHSLFTFNLIQLVQYCHHVGIKATVLMETGSLICRQREMLVIGALEMNPTHIMWLDSDMMFPPDLVERLLDHDRDIVACNYPTRSLPFKGVAYTRIGDWNSWLGHEPKGSVIEIVEGVGMGCMLVKSSVYQAIKRPWFEINWMHEYQDHIGEDFYFCIKARKHGYEIAIDTVQSQKIKHVGLSAFDMSRTAE